MGHIGRHRAKRERVDVRGWLIARLDRAAKWLARDRRAPDRVVVINTASLELGRVSTPGFDVVADDRSAEWLRTITAQSYAAATPKPTSFLNVTDA